MFLVEQVSQLFLIWSQLWPTCGGSDNIPWSAGRIMIACNGTLVSCRLEARAMLRFR